MIEAIPLLTRISHSRILALTSKSSVQKLYSSFFLTQYKSKRDVLSRRVERSRHERGEISNLFFHAL